MRRSMPGWSSALSRSASCATASPKSRLKRRDECLDVGRDVLPLQSHREIGDHETRRAAAVVAFALEAEAMHRLLADQLGDGVGQLDLASGARLLRIEPAHHFGLHDVAARKHQVGRGGALRRLLDYA